MTSKDQAEQHKKKGNDCFSAQHFEEAIGHFSKAIELDPENHILFSNRAACYASLKQYDKSLEDAKRTVVLNSQWPKGHTRLGAAYLGLQQYSEAAKHYLRALDLDEEMLSTIKGNLEQINQEISKSTLKYQESWGKNREVSPPYIPDGAWVTMITPFTFDNKIDWIGIEELVEFYIREGISGIFSVCLSSEMYDLSREERLTIAQHVVTIVKGRVPVVACGNFDDSIEDQAKFIREIYNTGVQAVVIIASKVITVNETESVFKDRIQSLMKLTDNIPLGVYECPKPYHRLLSPELMVWLAETGRFYFFKDTSCSIPKIQAKLEALFKSTNANAKHFKFFNANMATLLKSMEMGAHGFSGIAANCYPGVISWMLKNRKQDQADIVQSFLTVAEMTVAHKYPQSAKIYLRINERGFRALEPKTRISQNEFNEEELIRIVHLKECVRFALASVKVAESSKKSVLL